MIVDVIVVVVVVVAAADPSTLTHSNPPSPTHLLTRRPLGVDSKNDIVACSTLRQWGRTGGKDRGEGQGVRTGGKERG